MLASFLFTSLLASILPPQQPSPSQRVSTTHGAAPLGGSNRIVRSAIGSPDGSRVAFRMHDDFTGESWLYSTNADGSTPPTALMRPVNHVRSIDPAYQFTPDGERVLYEPFRYTIVAPQGPPILAHADLRSQSPEGGPEARIGNADTFHSGISSVLPSPDGQTVVFQSFDFRFFHRKLFRAPVDGSSAPELLSFPWMGSLRSDPRLSPDGRYLVVSTFLPTGGRVYSLDVAGDVTPTLLMDGINYSSRFDVEITPDSQSLAIVANQEVRVLPLDGSPGTGDLYEFSEELIPGSLSDASSGYVVLNSLWPRPGGGYENGVYSIRHDVPGVPMQLVPRNPGGARILGDLVLYVGGIGRSLQVQLLDGSQPATTITSAAVHAFEVSPDETQVVFVADHAGIGVRELFVAPSDGSGSPVRISAPLAPGFGIDDFHFSPAGTRVGYLASSGADEVFFSAPLVGGQGVQLSAVGFLLEARLISEERAIFISTQGTISFGLYSIRADGTGPLVLLSPP